MVEPLPRMGSDVQGLISRGEGEAEPGSMAQAGSTQDPADLDATPRPEQDRTGHPAPDLALGAASGANYRPPGPQERLKSIAAPA